MGVETGEENGDELGDGVVGVERKPELFIDLMAE